MIAVNRLDLHPRAIERRSTALPHTKPRLDVRRSRVPARNGSTDPGECDFFFFFCSNQSPSVASTLRPRAAATLPIIASAGTRSARSFDPRSRQFASPVKVRAVLSYISRYLRANISPGFLLHPRGRYDAVDLSRDFWLTIDSSLFLLFFCFLFTFLFRFVF